jgi:uncharacterized protein
MQRLEVEQRTILIGLVGSNGYGLSRPESDLDYRGVFIAGKSYYLGLDKAEQKDSGWDVEPGIFDFIDRQKDTVIYELKKFIQLLTAANPNSLDLLWLKQYPVKTAVGEYLIQHRQMFLTKRVKHTYSGYAFAQIKKIESHRKWLLNPPTEEPTPAKFGLAAERPLNKEELHAFLEYLYSLVRGKIEYLAESQELHQLLTGDIDYKGILKQHNLTDEVLEYTQNLTNSRSDFIKLLQKSQQYHNALKEWNAYQSWKTNRNPARAGMEKKSGFDLKHAMHCIRILRSGLEILRSSEVFVDRPDVGDADELKAILHGELTYEQVTKISDNLMTELDRAYDLSILPAHPDLAAINQLCIELVEMQGWEIN